MNKFIKKLFTVAVTLSMTMPNLLSVVHAYEPLEYGKSEQQASDGNVLLDVKGTDVTVETSGSEQTISGDEGTRQEIAKGSVIKATGVTYFVAFHKDGSYETFTGDVEYQTNENTAYVSIVGGVSQTHSRKKRSTGDVNSLAVGDTFSGTFGTSNTNPDVGSQTFYVDAVTGLLAQVSDQIIGSQYVSCQEHGYVGLTNINAWSLGRKAEYVYNATVTSVAPDGTVTLSIDVPHYLKPGTNEEATGWNAQLGTVPYQRCAGTWTIKTAPRAVQMYVRVEKSNGNPDITKNNQCYAQDLSGAVYGVFRDSTATTSKVGEITTDANGVGALTDITVNAGENLYVRELKAPKGFALDSKIYTVSSLATAADGWYVRSTDMPMNDPVAIKLTKKSADKVENPASLEGAEFTVKYYAGQYTKETLPENATRTWVIKTVNINGRYITGLRNEWKVSGDDFYVEPNTGVPTLPLGTITIEETKAPNGYTLEHKTLSQSGTEVSDGIALFNITEDLQGIPQLAGGNEYTIEEGVSRGQFNTTKVDSKTGKALEGAKFKIVNKNNYDVVLKNENDEDLEVIPAGGESNFTFTSDKNGSFTGWTNMLQAGNYAVREIEAPKNYHTAEDVEFAIEHGKTTDVTVSDKEKEPKLGTHAHEFGTGSKLVKEGQVKLEDVANYENVRLGQYNYTTTLVAKGATEAEDEVIYNNTQLVDITDYNGELKTTVDVDTTKYGDKELVFYEELVSIENPEYGVTHKVRENKDQTVKVTKIRTTIKDKVDGDNIIDGTKTEQTVIDTISYFGLEVGKKYTATGTLMNKATGLPILVDGQPITNTVEFTATETNGKVEVPFTFNATLVAGRRIVAFESIKDENGIEVGIHADIEDMSQTFDVTMKLKLQIAKADKDNIKHFLKGAEFTLFNKDGSVYKDINGKDAIGVTNENGEVEMNVVYTVDNEGAYVMETKAPEGYEISTEKYPVKLTGKDTLGVDLIKITVLDEAIIIPPTGVETNPILWLGLSFVALAGVGMVLFLKKSSK